MSYSNIYNLPLSIGAFLAHDDYDLNEKEVPIKSISATGLLKSVRQIVLSKRLDTEAVLDISTLISSRVGSAYHESIANVWLTKASRDNALKKLGYNNKFIDKIVVNPTTIKPGEIPIYVEQRCSKKINEWEISGKFDIVLDGQLEDFKSTSVYTYMKQLNTDKYALQGSIYRWLNPDIITSPYLTINFIFTDWMSYMAERGKGYPPLKILSQNIPLLEPSQVESFISNKLKDVERFLDSPEKDIPYCNDEELWRKEDVWQYFSAPGKKASKNFDNASDANSHLASKGTGYVQLKKGLVGACKYCAVYNLCSQKDELIKKGEL